MIFTTVDLGTAALADYLGLKIVSAKQTSPPEEKSCVVYSIECSEADWADMLDVLSDTTRTISGVRAFVTAVKYSIYIARQARNSPTQCWVARQPQPDRTTKPRWMLK